MFEVVVVAAEIDLCQIIHVVHRWKSLGTRKQNTLMLCRRGGSKKYGVKGMGMLHATTLDAYVYFKSLENEFQPVSYLIVKFCPDQKIWGKWCLSI